MTIHQPMPVAGYTHQSDDAIAMVNNNKQAEEMILRMLDAMADDTSIDKRWLAVGRTHIEQGFMAINRAIFKPQRVALTDTDL
jgi:hypothetical protein